MDAPGLLDDTATDADIPSLPSFTRDTAHGCTVPRPAAGR